MHQLMLLFYGMNKLFTVYIHISPSHKYYIGMTSAKKVEERWGKNGNGYKNQYFKRAIDKYGWNNFIHLVVRDNLCKKDASTLEQLLISQLHSNNADYGYNISNGGECVMLGKHHTKEVCDKISDRFSISVNQYDMQGNLIHTWKSITEAEIFGFDRSSIAKCCKGIYKTSRGYVWRYINDRFDKYSLEKSRRKDNKIKVKQFSCDGELIKIWNSISDAAKKLSISGSMISQCCKGKKGRKTVKGFVWRYIDDDFDKYSIKNNKFSQVCQYNLDGCLINEFDTIHNASVYTGISSGNIISCCKGITHKAGNYIWKYKNKERISL
jgi:group I intron endonuclease